MLLVVTNSEDATADYFCRRLRQESLPFVRFDSDADLRAVRVAYDERGARLRIRGRWYEPADFANVWLRRPHPVSATAGRDAAERQHVSVEWGEALEGFLAHIPIRRWINHPTANVLASHKVEQLTRARCLGLAVPKTLVTQEPAALRAFWRSATGIIAKPLASGYLERNDDLGDTLIYTSEVEERHLRNVKSVRACPTLFQVRIKKSCDVRVCVIDREMLSIAMRRSDGSVDVRRDNMEGVTYRAARPPARVVRAVHRLVSSYGLRFGALDFVVDAAGTWYFLELNPNGQWAWLDLVGGADFAGQFCRALIASRRSRRDGE
jgi:hypothetical protein